MSNYFVDMLSEEEQKVIYYVPTFADFLKKVEKDFAEKPATTDGKVTYSFKELVSRVARRRASLAAAGVKPGDKVGVIARNDLDAMEWFLAVPSYGAILTMLPVQLGAEQITGISMKFGFAALVAADEFKPLTENVKCTVIPSSEIAESEAPYGDVKKESVAAIYFTGGTTGAPNLVEEHAVVGVGAHLREVVVGLELLDAGLRRVDLGRVGVDHRHDFLVEALRHEHTPEPPAAPDECKADLATGRDLLGTALPEGEPADVERRRPGGQLQKLFSFHFRSSFWLATFYHIAAFDATDQRKMTVVP